MATLLVTYDLRAPGRNYDDLHELLKSTGTWAHPLESVWFVVTDLTPAQARDAVLEKVDANDKVFVVDVSGDSAAWRGLEQSSSDWLLKFLAA